jgi:UrcA family protein
MRTSTMKITGFVVAASLAAVTSLMLSATPARAAASDEVTSVTVRFADLDLNTAKGSKRLYLRLKNAAETVCGDDSSIIAPEELRSVHMCEQTAIGTAVAQVDQPRLTVLYDHHFPREPLTATMRMSYTPAAGATPTARLEGQVVDVVVGRA